MSEAIDKALEAIEQLEDQTERHRELLEAIEENPDRYSGDRVEAYLNDLGDLLTETDLIAPFGDDFEALEEGAEAREAEFLANIELRVDDELIEKTRVETFEPEENRARVFVPSPKVNQVRGGRQRLVDEEGRAYSFDIEKTLVAEMKEDKTGMLELVLDIDRVE